MAIDHTGIGVRSVAVSAQFYDAALAALGLRRVVQLPKDGADDAIGYGADFPTFWIGCFHPHGFYAAFVLDPDGNNMEAVCREA